MTVNLTFWAFAVSHSLFISNAFKALVRRVIGETYFLAFYRLAFVAVSGLSVSAAVWVITRQPNGMVYSVPGLLGWLLRGVQFLGFALFALSFRNLDGLKWLGLRPALYYLRHQEASEEPYPFRRNQFDTCGTYCLVRHPMYLGLIVMAWAEPSMSLNHLIIAASSTLYFYIGSLLEERRMVAQFGEPYIRYQREVPRLIPWLWLKAQLAKAGRGGENGTSRS